MTENLQIINILKNALNEDKAAADITTRVLIPSDLKIWAEIIAKESGVVCGASLVGEAFKLLDKNIKFKANVKDGGSIRRGDCLARIYGSARAVLSAERVALNLLAHLSGIATLTNEFVKKVKPYKVKILDTRKTTPNLRLLERYAVRCGGGFNYRFDLSEQVLIKDNHIAVASHRSSVTSLKEVIEKIKKEAEGKKVEIEVDNLGQFRQALLGAPDIIMLDNFKIRDIKKAVKIKNHSPFTIHHSPVELEASGGITLRNIKQIAATGVDLISIGALTHSVKSLDVSLEISKKGVIWQ